MSVLLCTDSVQTHVACLLACTCGAVFFKRSHTIPEVYVKFGDPQTVRTVFSFGFTLKQFGMRSSPHSLGGSALWDCQNKGDAGEVGRRGLCSNTGRTG